MKPITISVKIAYSRAKKSKDWAGLTLNEFHVAREAQIQNLMEHSDVMHVEHLATNTTRAHQIEYISLNKQQGGVHPNFCVYCGDFNQCRDHVIPVSMSSVYRSYDYDETVDCCMMCNSLAGDYPAANIRDKAQYLRHRYIHKYRKLLKIPHWKNGELRELSHNLRNHTKASENLHRLIDRKLDNLVIASLGSLPIPICDELILFFA